MLTLRPIRNLNPNGPATRRVIMHDTDTGGVLEKTTRGWRLSDPSRPYGNSVEWSALSDARNDLRRTSARYKFHPTGNGLQRVTDGYRPRDLTEAVIETGRLPHKA